MLSVIIPAFNEEETIENTFNVIISLLMKNKIENEIIFIDDGSTDKTFQIILKLTQLNSNITGIHFSRNFGKEAAISAGLFASTGDCAVVIDCDLQHPPEKIIEMFNLWKQGYEIVEGVKRDRGKNKKLQIIATKFFYSIMSFVTGFDLKGSSDFKLLDRKVINVLSKITEKGFFRAISYWTGFKRATVEFDVKERSGGKTKWSAVSLIKYALSNISSYTTAPMQAVTVFGFIIFFVSVFYSIRVFMRDVVENTTFVIITIAFIGSIIMISLGVIGYYIARIYDEVKGRPKYIISSLVKSKQK